MPKKPKSKKLSFTVSMTRPDGALIEDCRAYIQDAVSTWHGGLRPPGGYGDDDPGDPMFKLDSDSVKVKRHRS
jgi:hypothetical protein